MSTLAIIAIVIGSAFAYVVVAEVIWLTVTRRWRDEMAQVFGTLGWPVIPFAFAAWWLAQVLALRLPAWIVEHVTRRRTNLPRAEVRR